MSSAFLVFPVIMINRCLWKGGFLKLKIVCFWLYSCDNDYSSRNQCQKIEQNDYLNEMREERSLRFDPTLMSRETRPYSVDGNVTTLLPVFSSGEYIPKSQRARRQFAASLLILYANELIQITRLLVPARIANVWPHHHALLGCYRYGGELFSTLPLHGVHADKCGSYAEDGKTGGDETNPSSCTSDVNQAEYSKREKRHHR